MMHSNVLKWKYLYVCPLYLRYLRDYRDPKSRFDKRYYGTFIRGFAYNLRIYLKLFEKLSREFAKTGIPFICYKAVILDLPRFDLIQACKLMVMWNYGYELLPYYGNEAEIALSLRIGTKYHVKPVSLEALYHLCRIILRE